MEKTRKREEQKRFRKGTKGITLIALVITIIVLLILAGVSIAMLTGQNGILTQANNAKVKTEEATKDEQRKLAQTEAMLNTTQTEYKEGDVTVPIPAGFAMTKIEGENTIEDGLVIIDEKGNEFVWIPCTVEDYNTPRSDEWLTKQWEYTNRTWTDAQTATGAESIGKYGGFYVARYEAGVPEEADFYVNTDGAAYKYSTEKNTTEYIPVSKKGVQGWNYISQVNSKAVAEKMVSNETVQSYLIDSNAWDTICRKIGETGKDIMNSSTWGNYYNNTTTNYENINTIFANHSYDSSTSKWTVATQYRKGNVTGAPKGSGAGRLELATGASEDFKAYNIYDMAGNMWEWTTETSTDSHAALRGGSFGSHGSNGPVVYSNGGGGTGNYDFGIGFRVVLYVK